MEETLMKDSEVEVCTEEEGFANAWFRGILEENPTKSGRKKLRVCYMTLLDDDGSSLLVENVEPKFIRPVPPDNEYKDVVLEEGLMVDADHRDGWWTGVLIKKLESGKFLVYYDSPPDIIEFERNQLRAHLRWTGWKWSRPEIQELDKSMFSSGTMVEVSTVKEKAEVAWSPAMIVKKIEVDDEMKFIVKDCKKHLCFNGDVERTNMTVDSCCIRPTPPPFPVEGYTLLDRVEACRSSVWRQGLVRGVLADNRYMVCLESTKEEFVIKHSDLRPFKVWEDGVWQDGLKQNPVKETPSNGIKKKPMRSCSGAKTESPKRTPKHTKRSLNLEENGKKAETGAATGELRKKRANDVINDNTPLAITPQVKPTASAIHVTPSQVRTATPLKQTEADTQGKTSSKKTLDPISNKNGLNNSTQQKMLEEKDSEDKGRKRKREENQKADLKEIDDSCNGPIAEINDTSNNICNDVDVDDQPLAAWINSFTELSFDHSPIVVNNTVAATDVEATQGNGTLMILPFAKKTPFWKKYETLTVCKTIKPQSPHFSPLLEAKEDIREWTAVGMMVTFYGLLDEVKDLQLDVSSSTLSSLHSSFAELEKHGFDVATPQSRINKMLSLQNGRANKVEERKCIDKKIFAGKIERHKYKEEIDELECKILELKRQQAVAKEKKEAADKRKIELESCAETIDQELEDLKAEFQTIVSAPW